jgi:hypothetical protein
MANQIALHDFQTVRIGRRTFPFTTCEDVSRAYRATIDRLGLGGSKTPPCVILNASGQPTGRVSYNGRVWRGAEWQSGDTPIYDPTDNVSLFAALKAA